MGGEKVVRICKFGKINGFLAMASDVSLNYQTAPWSFGWCWSIPAVYHIPIIQITDLDEVKTTLKVVVVKEYLTR